MKIDILTLSSRAIRALLASSAARHGQRATLEIIG
jgi:hypothetical protein